MTVATLVNVPNTPQEFSLFSYANKDHHIQVIRRINVIYGITLIEFNIDPIPEGDIRQWLQRHQQMHTDVNNLLGIGGSDLSTVDFKDKAQLEAWIDLHLSEHQSWADVVQAF